MSMPTRDHVLAELPRLRRYARILTGDAAAVDDLVLNTLRRAWATQRVGRKGASLGLSLIAVMRELYESRPTRLRSDEPPKAAHVEAEHRPPTPRGSATESASSAAESLPSADRGFLAQFDQLPLDQREVLALVAVERLSYAEVADLLGMPVPTVMATLSRARAALWSSSVRSPPAVRED